MMKLKDKVGNTFKDMLGLGITEEEERELGNAVDEVVVDDINEVGKSAVEELKTEFIATNEDATVQKPIGIAKYGDAKEDAPKVINGNQSVFVEPKNYSECKKIANYIKESKTVTVNLENVEGGIAQRILDFISGASSIKGASFIPVSKRVYVIVPGEVEIVFDGRVKSLGDKTIKLED